MSVTRDPRSGLRQLFRPLMVMATVLTVLIGLAGLGGTAASAGGWAVGSLDAVPDATAGGTVKVGFTILQHGVRPVDLLVEPGTDVGIVIVDSDGSETFFPATSDGPVGHYIAQVRFPEVGVVQGSLRMGWFADQPLGPLAITDGTSSASSGWPAARTALALLAIGLAIVAFGDAVLSRRRGGSARRPSTRHPVTAA